MPENQRISGDYWTDEALALLKTLGWEQHGPTNFDITCINHKKERKGAGHGIDILCSYNEPYLNKRVGVIVEAKTRKWENITTDSLEKWVGQVIETLECATQAPELEEFELGIINTALILCWCNDGKYNHNKYIERLSKMNIPLKTKDMVIFIASNYDILRWCSIIDSVKYLNFEGKNVKFYYPSINNETNLQLSSQLSLIHMFSKYIFATQEYEEGNQKYKISKRRSIVFYFDDINLSSLSLMYSAFRLYQLQEADQFVFYLYKDRMNSRIIEEEFKKNISENLKNSENNPEIIIRHMNDYTGARTIPYELLGINNN